MRNELGVVRDVSARLDGADIAYILTRSMAMNYYARKMLLDGLDQITGEKFEGNLWRFVDWAIESERGKSLRLDLGGP
ncbi:MAG: hypothetical protein ACR2M4_05095 [Actinomycetota bacterium]